MNIITIILLLVTIIVIFFVIKYIYKCPVNSSMTGTGLRIKNKCNCNDISYGIINGECTLCPSGSSILGNKRQSVSGGCYCQGNTAAYKGKCIECPDYASFDQTDQPLGNGCFCQGNTAAYEGKCNICPSNATTNKTSQPLGNGCYCQGSYGAANGVCTLCSPTSYETISDERLSNGCYCKPPGYVYDNECIECNVPNTRKESYEDVGMDINWQKIKPGCYCDTGYTIFTTEGDLGTTCRQCSSNTDNYPNGNPDSILTLDPGCYCKPDFRGTLNGCVRK